MNTSVWTTWDKTMPQTAEDIVFLAYGPLDLAEDMCCLLLPRGAGAAQGLIRIVTEAGNTAWRSVCLRACAWAARVGWGRELNLGSQRHLWQDGFAHPVLAQVGLRGMITSFSENFRVFCAHRTSPNRYSQTLIRIFFKWFRSFKDLMVPNDF